MSATAAAAVAAPSHVVLEANIDDATGELLATCIESLLAAGALDAWTAPLTMKKGRPGHLLGALAAVALADADRGGDAPRIARRSASAATTSTASSGPRRIEQVETPFGNIPVKIAGGPFGPPQRKPELDACLAAARAHGVPVRQVIDAALVASATLR